MLLIRVYCLAIASVVWNSVGLKSLPNFVLFLADDLLYTEYWSESYPDPDLWKDTVRYKDIQTPNIDRLRTEGFIFPKAYATGPKCAPSRYSFLTGRNPSRSLYGHEKTIAGNGGGYYGMNVTVPMTKLYYDDEIYNLPYTLKTYADYTTIMVGKWHLYNVKMTDTVSMTYAEYLEYVDIVKGAGFDYVDGLYMENIWSGDGQSYSHNPEWMTARAQDFMQTALDNDENFFLYYAATLPHSPSAYTAMFNFSDRVVPYGELDASPVSGMSSRELIWNLSKEASVPDYAWGIAASTIWLDDSLGAIIDWLEAKEILNDTFILFASDHGMGVKSTLYEQGIRIPCFVRYPPFPARPGKEFPNFLMSSVDLAATAYEFVGIDVDAIDGYTMDGVSLSLALGDNVEYRTFDMYNSRAIITKDYKYIWRATDAISDTIDNQSYICAHDREQLYELNDDPTEQTNLIDNNVYIDTINYFRRKMKTYVGETCPIDSCKLPPDATEDTTTTTQDPGNDDDTTTTENPYDSAVVWWNLSGALTLTLTVFVLVVASL